jgi:hypothetical protein
MIGCIAQDRTDNAMQAIMNKELPAKDEARKERQAAELRENLKKRKAQMRARKAASAGRASEDG